MDTTHPPGGRLQIFAISAVMSPQKDGMNPLQLITTKGESPYENRF